MIRDVSFISPPKRSRSWKWDAERRRGHIGLSAALEWLSDIDIEQAENWPGAGDTGGRRTGETPAFVRSRCRDSSLPP